MPVNMAGLGSEDSSGLEIGLDKYLLRLREVPGPGISVTIFLIERGPKPTSPAGTGRLLRQGAVG